MSRPASFAAGPDPFAACRLCPRECGADRTAGRTGFCGETAVCRIASATPHFGEEPPIRGTRGSGTIFFAGCSCRCFFCQNHQISSGACGRPVTAEGLAAEALRLVGAGVHNLNFVTPDHVWPHIAALAERLRAEGHALPFVFNGSGYHRPGLMDLAVARMEIFLPDFKFSDPALAGECLGDERYPDLAADALRRMVAARGFLEPFDPRGREPAREGVLVRHLVLPGETENSLGALRRLREEFGRWLPISVMSQFHPVPACAARVHGAEFGADPARFHPVPACAARGRFAEPVRAADYARVCEEAVRLGFEQVFIQPAPADGAFLPDFRNPQPFRGNEARARAADSGGPPA